MIEFKTMCKNAILRQKFLQLTIDNPNEKL